MAYIEGFVAAEPTANREKFVDHASAVAEALKEHGALKVVECWGVGVPEGEVTSFPKAVICRDDETVIFSWVTWPSKDVRDAAMERFMADPRVDPAQNPMPFDGKRMFWGGFEIVVQA